MAPHAEIEVAGFTDTSSVVKVEVNDSAQTKISGMTPARPVFTIDDVLPHRQKSKPPPTIVAAFSDANMFKSKGCLEGKPKAKSFAHRLTAESKSRKPSSLKGAMKYFKQGTISLCGGLPSSEYFPFEELSAKIPTAPEFTEAQTATSGKSYSSGKHDATRDGKALLDLSIALNYGQSMGPGALIRFLTEHTEIVHSPPYSDWDICMTSGSTSALDVALRMFTERGQYVLTEEYTFSSAIETVVPLGAKMLGVKMDADGMLPDDLDNILSNWDEKARRAPKPFLVYTVPTGQNPTASTQSLQRRKQIYAVAEKHDLFILEDEPYYFLQMDPFVSGHTHAVSSPFEPVSVADFLSNLVPSYLSIDTSGRVLRLDSFSKIIAPGSRAGWVTGAPQVIERFMRHNEVSAQTPSGFSLIALYNLLEENWGHKGFLEWLMFIRAEYTRRRDIIVNACEEHLPSEVCSWVPPKAGMFHWIHVDLTRHPVYKAKGGKQIDVASLLEIEDSVFTSCAEQGVLIAKGSWFRAQKATDTELFFRTTFAAAPADKMREAIEKVGVAIRKEFEIDVEDEIVVKGSTNGHAK
ncbi:Aromatic/aminoadipate aminotransferase 1 [Exophiala xenobiotica]|nr:Aromatic/aminoadipate aminotransferase 1 [Exophiala xenobiotica]KAK5274291.1 Aromatic/aminoadipate aminotransferase 1 [Exophiala xenobiotica]KAK5343619.1 Aromatic/aminoadipate aminotransferase 1 [Exophiala xenobiotica]KAK5410948.1 Aromatic/aminoadipate aminotransferase 1 [Exophiala xenobiotica]KAK5559261.1 Aromatic/aminoadipate aminotransferase 1 [Exophiala xenobiotica]